MNSAHITHHHAAYSALAVLHQADGGGTVTDLNAISLRDREPHPGKADPLIGGAYDCSLGPLDDAADFNRAEADRWFEPDSLLSHPACSFVGIRNQDFRQLRVAALAGHSAKVGPEALSGIGFDAFDEAFELARLGHQSEDFLGAIKGDSEQAAAIMGIPAAHVLSGFLQHQDALGTRITGGDAGCQGGVAGAHNNDVVIGHWFCLSQAPGEIARREELLRSYL